MFYKLQNHLWLLIKLLPDKDWDWNAISRNINTTWDIIENNLDKPWDWGEISLNPNITLDIVRTNQTFSAGSRKGEVIQWDYARLLCNINLTWEIISEHFPLEHLPLGTMLCWNLSRNKNITWDMVKKNIDKQWDWMNLFDHIKITAKDIKSIIKIIRSGRHESLHFGYLSRNSYIFLKDIENIPEFLEYTEYLSRNKNITWEFVKKHLDKPWNWVSISQNSNITWEIIKNTRILPRNVCAGPCDRSVTDNTSPWATIGVSSNPNITWDIVIANPEFPWEIESLSYNPNITWKNVRDDNLLHGKRDWNYSFVSFNTKDLTWKDVIDNPDFPWDFSGLSSNTFGK
jgi:hypothetical protein